MWEAWQAVGGVLPGLERWPNLMPIPTWTPSPGREAGVGARLRLPGGGPDSMSLRLLGDPASMRVTLCPGTLVLLGTLGARTPL